MKRHRFPSQQMTTTTTTTEAEETTYGFHSLPMEVVVLILRLMAIEFSLRYHWLSFVNLISLNHQLYALFWRALTHIPLHIIYDAPYHPTTRARLLDAACYIRCSTKCLMQWAVESLPRLTKLELLQKEAEFTLPAMPLLDVMSLTIRKAGALAQLTSLTKLRVLQVETYYHVRGHAITLNTTPLSSLVSLTHLSVTEKTGITLELPAPLPTMTTLTRLELNCQRFPRLALEQLPSLERLTIGCRPPLFVASDHDTRLFARLRYLQLDSMVSRVAPHLWPHFSQLLGLQICSLFFTTEAARSLTTLTGLTLIGNSPRDTCLPTMISLRRLILDGNETLTLDDVRRQTALTRLELRGRTTLPPCFELNGVEIIRAHTINK